MTEFTENGFEMRRLSDSIAIWQENYIDISIGMKLEHYSLTKKSLITIRLF